MKNIIACIFVMVLGNLSISFAQGHHGHDKTASSSSSTPTFKSESTENLYQAYISLTQALVQSDEAKSKKEAETLASLAEASDADAGLKKAAKELASAADIKAIRLVLADLSPLMKDYIKGQLKQGEVYVAFCPMANGNTGGYWLANEKQINNPYFGDKMLRCGSVKETLQ